MKKTLLIAILVSYFFSDAQQFDNTLNVLKDRPADFEYLSAPDSLGNRLPLLTAAVAQTEQKTQVNNIKLPYPVIFIHGLNSSAGTWLGTTNSFMVPQYGLVNGGRFDYCLNYDGNKSTANANFYPTVGADIAVFNGTWLAGDFYYVNFDVGSDGSFSPSFSSSKHVLSNQSAIVKQGRALQDAIARVLMLTGRDKVILMGHSMGGLAAREYLQNPSNWQADGQTHVAKLATTGTPHGGSNSTSFGVISGNTDGQSEAIRDLRRSFYYTNNQGVYLFGGPENLSYMEDQWCCYFYNADVNCNGTSQTNVIGLNQKNIYNNIDYSCIIGQCSSCLAAVNPGDGVVWDVCADLNNYYPNITKNVFYYNASAVVEIHTDLPQQYYHNMQGIDEPEFSSLAYHVGFDSLYTGFLTVPASGSINYPKDVDFFKFVVKSPKNVNVSVGNIVTALGFTVNIINTSNQIVGSAVHASGSTAGINFTTPLNVGNYYLQISAVPTATTYLVPYNFILQNVSVTHVKNIGLFDNIQIFPNPTASLVNILDNNNLLQHTNIEIKNYLGQTVQSGPFANQVNISALPAGVYFMCIKDEYQNKTFKIIKQ